MVVVHVGDDHVGDLARIDPDGAQAVPGAAQKLALAPLGHLRVEAGVEDEGRVAAHDRPDEIVQRHRAVVRVAADEVLAGAPIVTCVADRVELVGVRSGHFTILLPVFSLYPEDLAQGTLSGRPALGFEGTPSPLAGEGWGEG